MSYALYLKYVCHVECILVKRVILYVCVFAFSFSLPVFLRISQAAMLTAHSLPSLRTIPF